MTAAARVEAPRIAWQPQPGGQRAFLSCPVTEVLFAGNRGGGKTDSLIMDFAQHVGLGYGPDWRGVLFRRTYVELADIELKTRRWFAEIFPEATYNQSTHLWRWPGGEQLSLSYMEQPADYWKHHGFSFTWIGWEELTNWATDEGYRLMFSCLRSTNPRVPRKIRATCNPSGRGHGWVKARFEMPVPHGKIAGRLIRKMGEPGRIAIRSDLSENRVLLDAEPDYRDKLRAAADSPAKLKAWLEGSWEIVDGGMFDDLWRPEIHIVPPIPPASIPAGWRLDRSYDDGQSHPFAVCWWAQSNGEPVAWAGRQLGEVRGDLIQIQEFYGWNGQPNKGVMMSSRDIAKNILEREAKWGVTGRVRPGPADGAIYNRDPRDPGASIAGDMERVGVSWEKADKSPGSRKQGWTAIRQMLRSSIPGADGRRNDKEPGLFFSSVCRNSLRTLPVAPRDAKDPDEVDDASEDHAIDAIRYRVRRARVVEKPQPFLVY